jgi:hypothetical protein
MAKRKKAMNTLIKRKEFETALQEEVSDLVGENFGQLLKFDANEKNFSIIGGADVELGHEYVALCDQYARGWVKFVDKKPVSVRIKKLSEGQPPAREDLDDEGLAGTEDDPWVFQRYLPLQDVKTGEVVTFVGKSVGSKIALGNLLSTFAIGSHHGRPIIKLAIASFGTRDYGKKPRPDFVPVRWIGGAPIEAEGPPQDDPSDPGYDLSELAQR